MGCEANAFCSSLEPDLRKCLCAVCHRELRKAGSIENYEETRKRAFVIIDGLMIGRSFGDRRSIRPSGATLSRTVIVAPGYLAGFRGVFAHEDDDVFASSFIKCVTDCCVARFEQSDLESLFRASPAFQKAAAESMFDLTVVMSLYLGMALEPMMNLKIEQAMAFLLRDQLFVSEKTLAEMFACSRTTVSRAFGVIAERNPELMEAYRSNKLRRVKMQDPE